MAEEFKNISLKGLESYAPSDSDGPAALLEKDGNYKVQVIKAEAKKDKDGGQFLALMLAVQDDDAKGSLLYANIFPEGTYESGKKEGQLRAQVLIDLLTSAGKEARAAELVKVGGLHLPTIATELVNAFAHARVQRQIGLDGQERSEPRFWIRQAKYEESRKSGVNFRTAPNPGRGRRTAGTTAPNGAAGTSSSTVSNAMMQEV